MISSVFLILMTISLAIALFRKSKETKRLREQLKYFNGQTVDELYSRGKFSELGLMSSGIIHEISNPLSIILGRLTHLMRINPSPETRAELLKGLEQIKSNADRISSILESVREYIYLNTEQTEEFISLRELINSVLVFFGQRLNNHGIELRLKDIDNTYVSGNKGQFEQALLNLVSNSFDAIDILSEKWIEISAKKSGDYVQIFVKDSGFGIPADVREHMLDPYFTTKKNKGSGLGLSLVSGIAQKNGGELKYVEDEHTTFMLQLPKASSMQYQH